MKKDINSVIDNTPLTEQELDEVKQELSEIHETGVIIGSVFNVKTSGMELFQELCNAKFITFQDGQAVIRFARLEEDGYTIETVAAVNLAGMGERAIKKLEAGLDPAKDAKVMLKKLLEKTPNITQEQLMEIFQELSKIV